MPPSKNSVCNALAVVERSATFTRRRFGLLLASTAALPIGSAFAEMLPPGGSVKGLFPNLAFTMTRASDDKVVTATDYRGDVVVLYFGFTRCADTCPLTMQNAARVLAKMESLAHRVRVLFVTVDLAYDTLPRLKSYLANFGSPPEFDGLRGTSAQLAVFAKRYAVGYKAPTSPDAPDPISKISHSAAVYLFDAQGRAQQILGQLGSAKPEITATAADLDRFARKAQD